MFKIDCKIKDLLTHAAKIFRLNMWIVHSSQLGTVVDDDFTNSCSRNAFAEWPKHYTSSSRTISLVFQFHLMHRSAQKRYYANTSMQWHSSDSVLRTQKDISVTWKKQEHLFVLNAITFSPYKQVLAFCAWISWDHTDHVIHMCAEQYKFWKLTKQLSHPGGSHSDKHFIKLWTRTEEERNISFTSNSLGQQSLPSPRWTN